MIYHLILIFPKQTYYHTKRFLSVRSLVFCAVKMSQQTLDHEKLESLLESCKSSGNYSTLKQTLWEVFSNQECLANSWSNSSIPGKLEFSWEQTAPQHSQANTHGGLLQPGVPRQLMV